MDKKTGIAKRSKPRGSHAEVELCGRCHSRRSVIEERYEYGKPLMNTHRPALLDGLLYHADGQIDDEVFVYGSFLQSKMYRSGVTCNDCHGSVADSYVGRPMQIAGVSCEDCHMPMASKSAVAVSPYQGDIMTHLFRINVDRQYQMFTDDGKFVILDDQGQSAVGLDFACMQCHPGESRDWLSAKAKNFHQRR